MAFQKYEPGNRQVSLPMAHLLRLLSKEPRLPTGTDAPSGTTRMAVRLIRAMQKTATLPRTTEAERLVVQRIGQDIFRAGLMDYWEGKCAITGLAVPELLRASHIKPWADCETDAERLDVFNGLLLAPLPDALFDEGFITFSDDGAVIVSGALGQAELDLLGLGADLRIGRLADGHRAYSPWHRSKVFRP